MSSLIDEETRKRYSQAAAIDAQRYNAENEGNYTADQLADAAVVRDWLDSAYEGGRVYRNCRQKYISVTVNQPGQNRYRPAVRILNTKLEAHGVTIRKTKANNFVYKMPAHF